MTVPAGNDARQISPALVLAAYRAGYFPMADSQDGPIAWYSPDPRTIIPLDTFHVSRSLRRVARSGAFTIAVDRAFDATISNCAARSETWISNEIIATYSALHRLGYAHSVESWRDETLAGGLYGIALGGAFFGESMFSREPDASKVALVHLVDHLRRRGFQLLDTQLTNPHLKQFGIREIPRVEYLKLLAAALDVTVEF